MPVDARTLTLQRPRSLTAALAMLAKVPALTPIAGCTDVMVGLHFGTSDQRQFIDLWPLDELRGITLDKPEGLSPRLRIGALTTYAEIIASPVIRKRVPMLVAAAREVGGADPESRDARWQHRQCLAGWRHLAGAGCCRCADCAAQHRRRATSILQRVLHRLSHQRSAAG